VGYESKAAPRSLRSAVNQALAKLSRDGKVQKYRQDGSVIAKNEPRARARKYRAKA
jgi:DNA-binding GntR family transcriptional regulator